MPTRSSSAVSHHAVRRQGPHVHVLLSSRALLTGLFLMLPACEGIVTSGGQRGSLVDNPGAAQMLPVQVAPGSDDAQQAPSPRFARLTHTQWENSVRDLLGLDRHSGLSSTFPNDPQTAGFVFDNNATALQSDQALASAYARAAERLAEQVTGSASLLSRLTPAGGDDRSRARSFVAAFGERAFRRPLDSSEVDNLLRLYDQGTSLYEDASGFEAGIRILIETFLQSPHFLYRIESSSQASGQSVPLSNWEIGQRLSYLIVNSTPDGPLLDAARAGQLTSAAGLQEQAARLLATDEARPALVRFHGQLLEFEKYASVTPSPFAYPAVTDDFGAAALESSELFVSDLAFNQRGGFADLMSSSDAFVNSELARVYGLSGSFSEAFERIELPESERRGILNQVGFLAANSTSVHPDPIHRGVFISTRILCRAIAAPPDGVPPLPPIAGGTNRQVVAQHTETSPVCRTCHQELINPFGFAFENYDATGAYRTTDNGFPVDSAVTPLIDGVRHTLAGSLELVDVLATSPEAHNCFASHLVEYAFGRGRSRADAPLIESLSQASQSGASVVDLIVQLAQSPLFSTRSAQELP